MLTSDKIYLKKIKQEDLAFYQEIYSNENLMRYVGTALTEKSAKKYLELTVKLMSKTEPKIVLYVIYDKASHNKTGVVGLTWDKKQTRTVEIGVVIKQQYQRKAFAHHAKKLLMAHAFESLGINCIIAHCDKANIAANNANSKLSFKKIETIFSKKRNCLIVKWELLKNKYDYW